MNYIIVYPYQLNHHGVKGMKWGIRKDRASGSRRKVNIRGVINARKKYNSEVDRIYNSSNDILSKKTSIELEKAKQAYYKEALENGVNVETVRKVAKGALITGAVVVGTAYTAYTVKDIANQAHVSWKFVKGDRLASKMATMPISKLGSKDSVLSKGSEIQRVVRFPSKTEALNAEKARNLIWATTNKNDNDIYRTLLNARGKGDKFISTRKVTNDIIMPSERKRVLTFMQMVNNDSGFRKALESDLRDIGVPTKIDTKHTRQYYDLFNAVAGNSKSKSAPMYFDKVKSLGYNALKDDNDAGYLGHTPTILLNATNDTVITGMKKSRAISEMMAAFRVDTRKI